MLGAGTLFQPQLGFTVRAAYISVGLYIPYLHVLALKKIGDRSVDIGEPSIFVNALRNVFRESAIEYQNQNQQYNYHQYGVADKKIYKIQRPRCYKDNIIQLVHPVAALHECRYTAEKFSHMITRFVYYLIIKGGYFQEINYFSLLNIE